MSGVRWAPRTTARRFRRASDRFLSDNCWPSPTTRRRSFQTPEKRMKRVLLSLVVVSGLGCGAGDSNAKAVKETPQNAPTTAKVTTGADGKREIDPEMMKKRNQTAEERINAMQGLSDAEKKQMIEDRKKVEGLGR